MAMNNGESSLSLLPPEISLFNISSFYTEYIPISATPPHLDQDTSPESFLADERFSWLEELLDEPEPPVLSRAHHRSSSDTEKREKQQLAKRSRVGEAQHIAELENIAQVLKAERLEAATETKFVNRLNQFLSAENDALKQSVEDLTQEHLVKCLEYGILEREFGRLRSLYREQEQMLLERDLYRRFSRTILGGGCRF